MFLKLTRLDDSKVIVNLDKVALVASNAIGRSVLAWAEPDLEALTVKESFEEIRAQLAAGQPR
jgi:hypothetical protein